MVFSFSIFVRLIVSLLGLKNEITVPIITFLLVLGALVFSSSATVVLLLFYVLKITTYFIVSAQKGLKGGGCPFYRGSGCLQRKASIASKFN